MKELIERLEKATGPCFGLEQEIMWAVYQVAPEHRSPNDKPKNYTYSVDAALTLVPEGRGWNVQGNTNIFYAVVAGHGNRVSPTPAIALCIAALKAREALAQSPLGKGEA